jgi:D-alanine-D-alanine ligase
MPKLNIAIISGGWSREKQISTKSGNAVYEALDKEKYNVSVYDPSNDLELLFKNSHTIDLAFLLLHGKYGEDGCIQGFLSLLRIPFVGSGVVASAMASNKKIAKDIYKNAGLKVIKDVTLNKGVDYSIDQVIDFLGQKTIVKPVSEGSSFGISVCNNRDELQKGIDAAFACDNEVLVEQFIKGREVTCCVLGNNNLDTLPIIEVIPNHDHLFFDYEAKYQNGASKEICPAELSPQIRDRVIQYAKAAHHSLRCRVWSRTDMIIHEDEIFILETNTIPGMTANSLVPLAARTAGLSMSQLLDRIVSLSLE